MVALESSDADKALTGATRTALLAAMRRVNKAVTVQQLADELGLHANTVRFHLARLVRAELVHEAQAEASGPGRPRMVYTAVTAAPGRDSEGGYQLLSEVLTGYLAAAVPSPADAAAEAGAEWGRHLAQRPAPFTRITEEEAMAQVTGILEKLDFGPERADADVLLHNCPFRTVADRRPQVVCSVHLGIMRGALAAMESPIRVTELQRFDAPHPCVAHFSVDSESAPAPAGRPNPGRIEALHRHAGDVDKGVTRGE